MNKNRKALVIFIAFVVIISYFLHQYYSDNYSNEGIFNHVTNRDGYSLTIKQEQVPVEFFVEPEWISFSEDERKELKIKVFENYHTVIVIDNVWNRGNDIYFSFHTTIKMKYKRGEFLYNGIFNEDGTFTSPSRGEIILYDKDQNHISFGQHGYGPGADFSFGIQPEEQQYIQNGFYVKYTGYMLYGYSRK